MGKQPAWTGKEMDWADMADAQAYPKREKFFAQKCLRAFVKTCAMQELGTDAFAMLAIVVTTEDAKRYRSAVTYYNPQLQQLLGIKKWDRLSAVRQSLIDAGWLIYVPPPKGSRRVPGRYWGAIPEACIDVDDASVDEGDYIPETDNDEQIEAGAEPQLPPKNGYGTGDSRGYRSGYGRGYGKGEPSYPIPIPNPSLSVSEGDHIPKTDTVSRRPRFQLSGRWDTPDVLRAIELWAGHYESQNAGERYSDIMADAQCQDATRRGWSPQDLIENITHSIAKGSRKTIIDRQDAGRYGGQGSTPGAVTTRKPYVPPMPKERP